MNREYLTDSRPGSVRGQRQSLKKGASRTERSLNSEKFAVEAGRN